jgi:hypothetical protein
MMKTILKLNRRSMIAAVLLPLAGCIKYHARTGMSADSPATMPAATMPAPVAPTTAPVATEDLGDVGPIPGLLKKPKPFIALPKLPAQVTAGAQPSTLLLEHATSDSPVPLSEYARQPVHSTEDFHLRSDLSAAEVKRRLGPPAQLAVNDDPWLVYRLSLNRELWLHFSSPDQDHLLAADIIRSAEDGYVREPVFPAP